MSQILEFVPNPPFKNPFFLNKALHSVNWGIFFHKDTTLTKIGSTDNIHEVILRCNGLSVKDDNVSKV